MALGIDTVDGCGLSNKGCCELLSKRTIAAHFTVRDVLPAVLYEQDGALSYKSGRAIRAVKLIKEDWYILL